jgi:hypothetical protein
MCDIQCENSNLSGERETLVQFGFLNTTRDIKILST